MISKILMPASGQTAAESLIVKWHAAQGDTINRGDVLFDIETDKATLEVESYAKGCLLKICYGEGEKVKAGSVVAYIGNQGEKIVEEDAVLEDAAQDAEDEYKPIIKQSTSDKADPQKEIAVVNRLDEVTQASPAARLAAKNNSVDISELYKKLNRPVKAADIAQESSSSKDYESIIPSSMRRTIAKRMLASAMEAPQFTVTIKPDMSNLIELRNRINGIFADENTKISFNDLLIKCVCIAAKKVPYINSVYNEDEIRLMKNINVGIAVALDDGLVVPVVKNAQRLSIKEIATKSTTLIDKAKKGTLTIQDMQGGSITISNLGMYGINNFTALVNRPESAIIAVGAIIQTPVGIDGAIELRPIADMTASFDHRVIDGGVAAKFMAELKKVIESPFIILF